MATTPVYFWPYQALTDPPNGATLGANLALAIETTMQAGNAALGARIDGHESAWLTFVPLWQTTGVAPAIGNGVLSGWYKRIGSTTDVMVYWAAGSTTTFGTGEFRFTIPYIVAVTDAVGAVVMLDGGTTRYSGSCSAPAASQYLSAVSGSANFYTSTNPITFANGDAIWLQVRHQT